MKQFIRIPRTSEISDNLISDILKARFPEYSTSIHGNEVRMRKNALTTVCVKCKQERNETVITIDTILFWWVWLIIGWIFYLVSKKGVIDEVYSTLVRDLSNRFPDKFRGYPSAYESAIWASKTKSLFKIGLGIVIYYTIFNSFLTPILINYIFGEIRHDTSGIILFIFVKNFWMCDILWILLGVYFLRLKKLGVGKRTGLFLMIYGIVGLLFGFLPYISESLNTILFNDEYQIISIITVSSSYLILLLYMGYFCKNELKTGPARYFDISICIYAITSYVTGVIFTILSQLWKKEGIIFNEYYLYVTIIETLLSLVTIYACFMLLRALHKMPKYPPVKTIQENDESTEFVVQQPQPSRKLQSESNPKPKPVSEPKPNLKPKPISTPKSGDSKRYKKSFIGALKYQIKNLLPNYKYAMILIFINTLFLNLYGSNLLDIWLNVKTSNIDIFYGITQSILVISLFVIWIKQTPSNAVDLIIIVFIGSKH